MVTARLGLLKPYKSIAEVNEYFKVEGLIRQLRKDVLYSLEPKIDGMCVQVHRDSEGVAILAGTTEITSKLPRLVEEIEGLPFESFDTHAELVMLDSSGCYRPHEDIVAVAHRLIPYEGDRVIIVNFDLLTLEGTDFRESTLQQRQDALRNIAMGAYPYREGSQPDRFFNTIPYERVGYNEIEWAIKRNTTSEGVVLKAIDSTYSVQGGKDWWKLKWLHECDVAIVGKRLVKNSICTYNYRVALLDDNGQLKEVGRTMNTNVQAEEGDILTVRCDRIIQYEDTFGLYLARVKELREDKRVPDSFALLRQRSD